MAILALYTTIAAIIFGMNVFPAFMPATWTVVSFFAVRYDISPWSLAVVGAVAATLGRFVLAKLSRVIIRQNFLSARTKKNIDDIKTHLQGKQGLTFGLFLLYAFSPFPSNQLFIAYGLTNMPLATVTVPFLMGRLASYFVLASLVVKTTERFMPHSLGSVFGAYFFVAQAFTIVVVYLFTKINWHALLTDGKLRWVK